jgi:UDP-glucose:(heptosyl)LPS alpha-1,3-glucosyltransferase
LETALFGPDGAQSVIANSKLVAGEIIEAYQCVPERINVVYNGLAADSFPAPDPEEGNRARSELELAPDDYVVLFAGSGWERKGLATALAAIARLPDQPRPRLLVAGRGDASAYHRKPLGNAPGRVRFLGPVKSMAACYAAADVFVLPTLYDPFSNACLEALAAGLPVITTAANGFAEIMEPHQDGEILPPARNDQVTALAEALARWSAPELRRATRAGRLVRASRFTIEKNVAQTLEIILRPR